MKRIDNHEDGETRCVTMYSCRDEEYKACIEVRKTFFGIPYWRRQQHRLIIKETGFWSVLGRDMMTLDGRMSSEIIELYQVGALDLDNRIAEFMAEFKKTQSDAENRGTASARNFA